MGVLLIKHPNKLPFKLKGYYLIPMNWVNYLNNESIKIKMVLFKGVYYKFESLIKLFFSELTNNGLLQHEY